MNYEDLNTILEILDGRNFSKEEENQFTTAYVSDLHIKKWNDCI